jgi:hypothetical protein
MTKNLASELYAGWVSLPTTEFPYASCAEQLMKTEDQVVTSPLSRAFDIGDHHLMINVFKGTFDDDDWFFEVVDERGRAEISDQMYGSDQAALEAALQVVRRFR